MQTFRLARKNNKQSAVAVPQPESTLGRDKQAIHTHGLRLWAKFFGAIIKIHFLSTVSRDTQPGTHAHMQPRYRWRHLVWISMAAATSFVSPSVYTFAALFPLSPSLSLSLSSGMCVCFYKCLRAIWMRQFLLNWSQKWPLIFDTISVIFTWPRTKSLQRHVESRWEAAKETEQHK